MMAQANPILLLLFPNQQQYNHSRRRGLNTILHAYQINTSTFLLTVYFVAINLKPNVDVQHGHFHFY
jgi:hypothetical protein